MFRVLRWITRLVHSGFRVLTPEDKLKTLVNKVLATLYGVFVLAIFLVLASSTLVIILAPSRISFRRYVAHVAARAVFIIVGMRLRTVDMSNLPTGPCVVVANHASYFDGVVLKAALPAMFSFVIKKEITRVPLASTLLKRIGSEFVDRFDRHAGGMDTRRLLKAAGSGQSLVLFPEGTFVEQPGLGKFHRGAFTIAARASLSVVPIAIRGTRAILPSGRFLPRPGRIEVVILPAIVPPSNLDASAVAAWLRDESRRRLVAAVGEPDLLSATAAHT